MRVSKHKSLAGYVDPEWVWDPSIAPSGLAFYPHDAVMFPAFQGHLLVGSLKFRQLWLVRLANGAPINEQIVMDRAIGRVRDVAVAPDGSILLLSDEAKGGLYSISR
jgi:glucose/arabinose dehydrogenase